MQTELSNNGQRVYDILTNDMQTINQISKKIGMNWHTTARELAILLVMDKVDVFIIKKEKKDQHFYSLKKDEVDIYD